MKLSNFARRMINLIIPTVVKPVMIIIPARLDSTRLPRKVVLPICGKPMVYHVYQRCIEAGYEPHEVIVAVDSTELQGILRGYGVNTILTYNKHVSGTDRVLEAAMLLNLDDECAIINIQGDEPEINPLLIRQLVRNTHNRNADIITLKVPMLKGADTWSMDVVKVVTDKKQNALYFSRSEIPYTRNPEHIPGRYKHVGVYGYKLRALRKFGSLNPSMYELAEGLEQLRALENGMTIMAITACAITTQGVDTENDYNRVKARMEKDYE